MDGIEQARDVPGDRGPGSVIEGRTQLVWAGSARPIEAEGRAPDLLRGERGHQRRPVDARGSRVQGRQIKASDGLDSAAQGAGVEAQERVGLRCMPHDVGAVDVEDTDAVPAPALRSLRVEEASVLVSPCTPRHFPCCFQ